MSKKSPTTFHKLSPRMQKELNAARRGSWGGLNPVTRVPPLSGAYRRAAVKAAFRREQKASDWRS